MLGHTNRTPRLSSRLPPCGFHLDSPALTDQSSVGVPKGGPPVSPLNTGTSGDQEGQHFRLARCIQLLICLQLLHPPLSDPCVNPTSISITVSFDPMASTAACSAELIWGACSSVSGFQRADSNPRVAPAFLVVFTRRCRVGWGVL